MSSMDPAILSAVSLDPAQTNGTKHGGSNFAKTWRIAGTVMRNPDGEGGDERVFFVKTSNSKDAEETFAGEHASLNAIHFVIPHLCPQSHAHGLLASASGSFLATDFLSLSSRPSASHSKSSAPSLAHSLATLHSTPAPLPPDSDVPVFGFPVPTYCGNTPQDNTYSLSWSAFFAHNRLDHILTLSQRAHGQDAELSRLGKQIIENVVPRLLADGHLRDAKTGGNVKPVVVHGDLWSGNKGWGRVEGREKEEEVHEMIFDPAACWAHSEYEWGIMKMFGGFGGEFEREYREVLGWDEPVGEGEDRVLLYELYHHLNHYMIFGSSGYKGSGMEIMRKLIKKYCESSILV